MIYCIFCDSEATTAFQIIEKHQSPMCEECATVFEMGQENFEALEVELEPEYDQEVA